MTRCPAALHTVYELLLLIKRRKRYLVETRIVLKPVFPGIPHKVDPLLPVVSVGRIVLADIQISVKVDILQLESERVFHRIIDLRLSEHRKLRYGDRLQDGIALTDLQRLQRIASPSVKIYRILRRNTDLLALFFRTLLRRNSAVHRPGFPVTAATDHQTDTDCDPYTNISLHKLLI